MFEGVLLPLGSWLGPRYVIVILPGLFINGLAYQKNGDFIAGKAHEFSKYIYTNMQYTASCAAEKNKRIHVDS